MEEVKLPCRFQKNVVLKDKTWIHRGDEVAYWLQPETLEELESAVDYCIVAMNHL